MTTAPRGRLATRFADAPDDAAWLAALERGPTPIVFLTPSYQRAWWSAFGRGQLLIATTETGDAPGAIAPLFADQGMVFFVGSGGSDALDFVGDPGPEALAATLESAREAVPDFVGFRFYHVPDASPTGANLASAAAILGLRIIDEGALDAPFLDLRLPGALDSARERHSLRYYDAWFRRNTDLEVEHSTDADTILPRLPAFFDQHVRRWALTDSPSLFLDPEQRRFYDALVREGSAAGWIRFTEIRANGRPIAFHLGFSFAGRYLCYKPTFEIDLARRSPGQVLFRELFSAAAAEGAHIFDFGIGDEPYKRRFATGVETVRTWGLYP